MPEAPQVPEKLARTLDALALVPDRGELLMRHNPVLPLRDPRQPRLGCGELLSHTESKAPRPPFLPFRGKRRAAEGGGMRGLCSPPARRR